MVCEDIERSARDNYNSLKLEREFGDQGILLFATDEPAEIWKAIKPATILLSGGSSRTSPNISGCN